MKKFFLFSLLPLLVLSLTGCFKKSTEKTLEQTIARQTDGQVEVDFDNDQTRVTFQDQEDGTQVQIDTAGDLDLPAGWPDDIELYAGNIVSAVTAPDGLSVMTQTKDQASQVAAWYDQQLAAKNWERVAAMEIADSIMRTYEQGSQGFTLVIGSSEGETTISHTYVAEY